MHMAKQMNARNTVTPQQIYSTHKNQFLYTIACTLSHMLEYISLTKQMHHKSILYAIACAPSHMLGHINLFNGYTHQFLYVITCAPSHMLGHISRTRHYSIRICDNMRPIPHVRTYTSNNASIKSIKHPYHNKNFYQRYA